MLLSRIFDDGRDLYQSYVKLRYVYSKLRRFYTHSPNCHSILSILYLLERFCVNYLDFFGIYRVKNIWLLFECSGEKVKESSLKMWVFFCVLQSLSTQLNCQMRMTAEYSTQTTLSHSHGKLNETISFCLFRFYITLWLLFIELQNTKQYDPNVWFNMFFS